MNLDFKAMAFDEDKARWEKKLSFCTEKVDVEDGNRLDFTIMCNGKRFVVTIYSTTSLEDQITPLVSLYNKAFQEEDDENLEKVQDEIEDIIYESGWRKFSLLVPANESGSLAPISLHSALNPDIFYFCLVTGRGYAHIIQEHTPSWSYFPVYLTINATSNLPRYSTREIQFTKKLMGIGYIAKVFVNRHDMCCKIVTTHTKAVQREVRVFIEDRGFSIRLFYQCTKINRICHGR